MVGILPGKSPDVKGKYGSAEVKSSAAEIPKALRQLAGGSGRAFVVLPKSEHKKALKRLAHLKTGLMDLPSQHREAIDQKVTTANITVQWRLP